VIRSRRRWSHALPLAPRPILSLLAGLLLCVNPLGAAPAAEPGAAGDSISIVSWNLEWFPGREPGAAPEQRAAHMAAARAELPRINPDIFLGQEIRNWDSFSELCASVPGLEPAVVSAFLLNKRVAEQQTAVASKLPALAAWHEPWRAATPQPPRGFSTATIELPDGRLLLVYSLHLKSNRARGKASEQSNFAQRDESVRQLLAHVREMETVTFRDRLAGIVVGGDFNTNHDGQFDDHVIELLEAGGFYNTWSGVPAGERHT
jgi:endonuclease/exonuclease/phosphatase family metal-dependent hydrolase